MTLLLTTFIHINDMDEVTIYKDSSFNKGIFSFEVSYLQMLLKKTFRNNFS